MKKISGGRKFEGGRKFGSGFGKKFNVVLKDGSKEVVFVGWLSNWLRPKVKAWWKSNVVSWERV